MYLLYSHIKLYTNRRASWRWLLLLASSPTKSLYLLQISSRLRISSSTVAIWFKSISLHSPSMPVYTDCLFFSTKGKLEIEKEKTRRLMKNLIEGKWRRVRGRKDSLLHRQNSISNINGKSWTWSHADFGCGLKAEIQAPEPFGPSTSTRLFYF